MKHLIKPGFIKYSFLLFLLTVTQAIAWAQDSTHNATSTTTTTTTTTTWYTQPWVWIVGGAVFILLIIALARGSGGRNDKVTITKIKDTV